MASILILLAVIALELAALAGLGHANAVNAVLRRRSRVVAWVYTVGLWFALEFVFLYGILFMLTATGRGVNDVQYHFFRLMGAAVSAALSWAIAARGRPIHPGTGDLSPQELAWVRDIHPLSAPCAVTVVREKGPGGKRRVTLLHNGQPVGAIAAGETFMFSTDALHNLITASDAAGLRLSTAASFDAPGGGRVEIFIQGSKFQTQLTRVHPNPAKTISETAAPAARPLGRNDSRT